MKIDEEVYTANGELIVTEEELYNQALKNYSAWCDRHGYALNQPSPALTKYMDIGKNYVIVELHNGETIMDNSDDTYLYRSTIKVVPEEG